MNDFCFIIPYRCTEDTKYRSVHLSKFVRHYSKLFPEAPIYVIEQLPKKDENVKGGWQGFMRGRLMNVGYLEFGKFFKYAAYHDVDMYVMTDLGVYKKKIAEMGRLYDNEGVYAYRRPDNPTQICTRASQFIWKLPYPRFMGGVTLFTGEQFEGFGGYSNEISSYGNEDDDLYNAVTKAGYTIDHRNCYFMCEDHHRQIVPELFRQGRKIVNEGRNPNDKLELTPYIVKDLKVEKGYTKLTVELDYL